MSCLGAREERVAPGRCRRRRSTVRCTSGAARGSPEQPRRLLREVGEDDVGAGAPDRRERPRASPARSSSQPLAAAALIIAYSPDTL